jgi:hypothetical protein
MAGIQEQLVDAVVSYLSGLTLSQSPTVEKKLVPNFERDQLSGFVLSVFAGPHTREKQSRSGVYLKTWSIGIVIRCGADVTQAEQEILAGQFLQLSEEIAAALEAQEMAGLAPVEIEQDMPFDQSKVSDYATFMAQFTIRYKGL